MNMVGKDAPVIAVVVVEPVIETPAIEAVVIEAPETVVELAPKKAASKTKGA